MASWVAPAVTKIRLPAKSFEKPMARTASYNSRSVSGSFPRPESPQARLPLSGSTNKTPRCFNLSIFSWVAQFSNIAVFMAGATSMGAFVASATVDSMSSAIPAAILAMMLAVAGTMYKRSAHFAKAMCSTSQTAGALNMLSSATIFCDMVRNVNGVTNSAAAFVIITFTSAPCLRSLLIKSGVLYAAIPPVTPIKMCFPFSMNTRPRFPLSVF